MTERLAEIRDSIGSDWSQNRYYEDAEGWIDPFWQEGSVFRRMFDQLDLANVVELACGHGRHATQCVDRTGKITLIDINVSNIDACRERFRGRSNVGYIVNKGNKFDDVPDASVTSIYCYDAMVHFEMLDVIEYIKDAHRALVTEGRALLHVSNNLKNPTSFYHDQPHWRNFMSVDIARHVADRVGFECLDHQVIDWSGQAEIDGLVLLQKR